MLKDVPKTLVYQLCEHRNSVAGHDLIPRRRSPSLHRLSCDRTNAMTTACLPTPSWTRSSRAMSSGTSRSPAWSAQASMRRRSGGVIDLVDHAEYKRRQAPPEQMN